MKKLYFFVILFLFVNTLQAQQAQFTRADTLRGTITPQRAWWDVVYYDLHLFINPQDSSINGYNEITYRVTGPVREMQIDLQQPLEMDEITQNGEELEYRRVGQSNAYFVEVPEGLEKGTLHTITVNYQGRPRVAENPPWDGGFIWKQDSLGNPWIATAVQGLGASAFWPNKDHQSDEPDSMGIHITVPDPLVAVSNGRLRGKKSQGQGMTTWSWFVSNPINNYGMALYIGNYVKFTDTYEGMKGTLDLSYWVLEHHLKEAKEQFRQVKPMLKCFEYWFGPYPFYEDSFKLVESPYLGMEHQSAVAYGNGFENGYRGNDLSGTGWGLKWDFIIIHESGHEWWGNSITSKDIADMWVHEGFTNYSEALYTECRFGKEAGAEYVRGLRSRIQNDRPIIGEYGVNSEGSGDMYYKAGNMLHMVRQIINNDSTFRGILHGIQRKFYHQTVTSQRIEDYFIAKSGKDLDDLFDQYLRETGIPVFQYYIEKGRLHYRWINTIPHFDMAVEVRLDEAGWSFIEPVSDHWKITKLDLESPAHFEVNKNYYVEVEQVQ